MVQSRIPKMVFQAYLTYGVQKLNLLIWSVTFSGCFLISCLGKTSIGGIEFFGETQGTTYHVIIAEAESSIHQEQLDSIFSSFDASLSTYIPNSIVSRINSASETFSIQDPSGFFKECYLESTKIVKQTNGAFDPTVFPLIEGWGFMNNPQAPLDKEEVDSLLQFVGLDRHFDISFSKDSINVKKSTPSVKLDFNAIAQGQSVDIICNFLESKGHTNYYVEIGGELVVSGKNREGEKWSIGVDVPETNTEGRPIENIFYVTDCSMATSGNYRKFYEVDGQRYAHTLDPKTGFPVQHSLLSATVIASSCAQADAYATAFMVMGAKKTLDFIETHPELALEVYLLVSTKDDEYERQMSDGFENYLLP